MDLAFSPDEQAFRAEVRTFLDAELPDDLRHKVRQRRELEREDYLRWQRILHARGWIAGSWPKEYGGCDWTPAQRHIFDEECHAADAPPLLPFGLQMVGPVIYTFGRPDQKEFFLPRLLSGEHWWCQGYSEPGSGSDLASLQTAAVRDGDDYIINGQKIWTSLAHHADWIFCLVRTRKEGKHQEGISFLLIDMKTPGITVRPLILMDQGHHVNEVFFENVRIAKDSHLGNVNEGWKVANTTLLFERGSGTLGRTAVYMRAFEDLLTLSAELEVPATGGRVIDNPHYRQKLAQAFIEFSILRFHGLNIVSQIHNGETVGPEVSMQKLYYSEAHKRFGELAMEIVSDRANHWFDSGLDDGKFQLVYLESRGDTIHSGTSQIQKNIIAERVLGMPR